MPSTGERVIKDSRKDSRPGGADLTDRFSCIFRYLLFHADYDREDFTNSPDTIAAGSEYLKVISFSFMFMGFSQVS